MIEIDLDGPVVSIFVDEIKIMAQKNREIIRHIKVELNSTFLIIDIDLISFYLGLKE